MSQPPRCRTCGKAEWGHTCLLGWIEIGPDGQKPGRSVVPVPRRVIKPAPRPAPPRAAPGKRRSLSFRALDDEGLRNLYNAVMAEKMRRAKKEPE